jgi:hypothetical protein
MEETDGFVSGPRYVKAFGTSSTRLEAPNLPQMPSVTVLAVFLFDAQLLSDLAVTDPSRSS